MSNHLAKEKSPYLLQHADNPVDWRPWGPEALAKAAAENKPILLSIGYATCHWCHVMAHESFEDQEVAKLLNDKYIPIKVDREERPDIDQIYMAACQALTGQGGWPLTAFLTPEGKPFYVGTYFPKNVRYGRPGFIDVLTQLSAKWETEETVIRRAADQLTQALQDPVKSVRPGGVSAAEAIQRGYAQLEKTFDGRWGGFGTAPKFPTPHYMTFLLRYHINTKDAKALEMVEKTLTAMRRGGIFDHIGLGFHRYSVDEKWLVPHFEKMLYDQALLAVGYTEAYQVTGKESFKRTADEILTYVIRDMTSDRGGFFAAEDADSDGREGLFYVWKPDEIKKVIGKEDGDLFCDYYGITHDGNFEDGCSIPHIHSPLRGVADKAGMTPDVFGDLLTKARQTLYTHREKRNHPLKDDKVLTAWNGLMIAAMAKASQAFDDGKYAEAASGAANFILDAMKTDDGRLLRRWRDGEAAHNGCLEDYAFMVWGLIELYEATFDIRHLEEAVFLTGKMIELFWDDQNGGFFFTGADGETLITRKKEVYDGAIPSGNSVAALNLLKLARMTGSLEFEEKADLTIKAFIDQAAQHPMAHTFFLSALDFSIGPTNEIVVAGALDDPDLKQMIKSIRRRFIFKKVVLLVPANDDIEKVKKLAEFTGSMNASKGEAAFYLCSGYACQTPLTDPLRVDEKLDELARAV